VRVIVGGGWDPDEQRTSAPGRWFPARAKEIAWAF
jgi:hypothetical protein